MVQVDLPWVGTTLRPEVAHPAILRDLDSMLSGTELLLNSALRLLSDASLKKQPRNNSLSLRTLPDQRHLPNTWGKAELVCFRENTN